ncbi:CpsD/CapB family tyrosine-protein kinase [Bacillus sp. JJ1566]|uniref:CpsD/CapB family tyrosine-protein kinase n=1 Tax=Bacillus sp. JJ1566 TaxID=3122961 RepID=UPI002FFF344B
MILNLKRDESIKLKAKTTHSFPESLISEQYRSIRTNIQFVNGVNKNQAILITSPGKREGKSTTVANLAISLTQQKEKVLLIDTNFKNPSLHSIFNIENKTGLTDVLKGKLTLEEAVMGTEVSRLDLLPSGAIPFNSSELIGSIAMYEIIEKALKKYNVVLIDSPSFLDLSGTKILASICNGVILVVKSGKTDTKKAIETKRMLDLVKAKIIGVIINHKK